MNVCILTSVHHRGDSRVFEKEARTLSENGYKVKLICADGKPDEVIDNIEIVSVPRQISRIKRILFSTKGVYKKALATDADIFHLQDSELVNVGVKLVKKGYKVIYDIHEDVVGSIPEKAWIPNFLKPIIARFLLKNEKKAAKKLSAVITATPYLEQKYKEYGGKNVIAICNYPRVSKTLEPLSYNERNIDAAYTGICLTRNRGALQMAEASQKAGVYFDVYGELRPKELKSEILDLIDEKNVDFHGIIPYAELQNVMRNVKIGFLVEHPTENAMNALCIKMFEYMCHGIPMICSNIPLWKEIIDSAGCGICVDPYNVEEIVKAIEYLKNNPAEAEKMGKNGNNAVMKKYSWEKETEKLLCLYEKVLG